MEKIIIKTALFDSSGLTVEAHTDKDEFWLSAGKNGYLQFYKLPFPSLIEGANLYRLVGMRCDLLPVPQPVFTASNSLTRTSETMFADAFVDSLNALRPSTH